MNKKTIIVGAVILGIVLYLSLILFRPSSNPGDSNLRIPDNKYQVSEEIEAGQQNIDNAEPANYVKGVHAFDKVIALTFDGMVDANTTEKIIELLEKNDAHATFFLPGIKSAEDSETVKYIADSGQEVGNYTLSATRNLEAEDIETIVDDFAKTNAILQQITGHSPKLLKANGTEYTDDVLKATSAVGIDDVVSQDYIINYQSFTTKDQAQDYVDGLVNGSILSIKTDSYLDDSEIDVAEEMPDDTVAVDMGPTIQDDTEDTEDTANTNNNNQAPDTNAQLIEVVTYLLDALEEDNYQVVSISELSEVDVIDGEIKDYQAMREDNDGENSTVINHFYTTEKAVAYTFSDITDEDKVTDILDALDDIDAKATFFVTGYEIQNNKDLIQEIVDRGHQLANGGYGMTDHNLDILDFDDISYEIDMGERYLKHFLGDAYDESTHKIYMPQYGEVGGDVLEAAASQGYTEVFTYNRAPIRQGNLDMTAEEIMDDYFANTISLQRGDVVHFRLNYIEDIQTIAQLIKGVAEQYVFPATYAIEPLSDLKNSPLIYEPLTRLAIAKDNPIKYSLDLDEAELVDLIDQYYIGNPSINTTETLHGFTRSEIEQINKDGRIETNGEKVIFLTFDDWGSDVALNSLLDVLDKYDVKATFFIRVGSGSLQTTDNFQNPNLLRAIALEGHEIGNHSFKHVTVDITSQDQVEMLQNDIVSAQYELERYLEGTGATVNTFRPPTLAVNKLGLETIFDMGFDYIVNGDFSTHDYEAENVDQLAYNMINGMRDDRKIEEGSIIVMHMSDEAQYTAEALDKVIPYYLEQGYRFARLDEYLKDGYSNDDIQ